MDERDGSDGWLSSRPVTNAILINLTQGKHIRSQPHTTTNDSGENVMGAEEGSTTTTRPTTGRDTDVLTQHLGCLMEG